MRGRKPKAIPIVKKKLSLPAPLVAEVDSLLTDELTGQPGHGEWSLLVERLLREYCASIKQIAGDIKP